MKLICDLDVGALYIQLGDRESDRAEWIDENTGVDVDAGGALVGIEVLDLDRLWPLDEIIRRYTIDPAQARQLMAAYPCRPTTRG